MNRYKSSVAFSMNIKLNFKIIVVGNRHAGKTSLILRYIKDIFEFNYKVTIGVEFYSKIVQDGDEDIAIQIWDTAGGENYKSVVRSFYNFAHCVLVVYDCQGDLEADLGNWMAEIKEHVMREARLVLVRTKIDLNPIGKQEMAKIEDIVARYGVDFFMGVSAKNNENVNELFTKIAIHLNKLHKTNEEFRDVVDRKSESILLTSSVLGEEHKKQKKCCRS